MAEETNVLDRIEALAEPILNKAIAPAAPTETKPAPAEPPPPATNPAPPAAPPEDDAPEAIKKTPKAWEHWKAKDDAHNKKMAALTKRYEDEISGYKSKPPGIPKEDYDKVLKERDDYSKTLRIAAIDKHPEFIAKYEAPMQTLTELAKQAAGKNGEAVAKLLRMPDNEYRAEQLDKIMEELGDSKKAQLGSVLGRVAELQMMREAELREPEAIIKRMEAEAARRSQAQQAAQNEAFERVLKSASEGERALDIFTEKKDDAAHNERVRELKALARAMYDGELTAEERANAALFGSIAPKLLEQTAAQAALLAQKDVEIAALKSGRPKMEGEDAGRTALPDDNVDAITRIVSMAANDGFVK